ncbi:MAG: redoxin domain-containing protein, partial [Myxococcota bacterium]
MTVARQAFRKINCEVIGISVDSVYAHLSWVELDRKRGGLGPVNIPLVSDLTHRISRQYGMLLEDAGHTCRATF